VLSKAVSFKILLVRLTFLFLFWCRPASLAFAVTEDAEEMFGMTLDELMDLEVEVASLFPEYSINLGLHYTLRPMDIKFYLNNRIYLNMDETIATVDPDVDSLPTYYRMDINISKIVSEKLEMILDIRDVLNRKNYVPAIVDCEEAYEEPGISVLLRAIYRF
jgi:hypothetical protein